jgi:hypothetical protein
MRVNPFSYWVQGVAPRPQVSSGPDSGHLSGGPHFPARASHANRCGHVFRISTRARVRGGNRETCSHVLARLVARAGRKGRGQPRASASRAQGTMSTKLQGIAVTVLSGGRSKSRRRASMKRRDACDDRDGRLHYRLLRARARERLTQNCVTSVTSVTAPFLYGPEPNRIGRLVAPLLKCDARDTARLYDFFLRRCRR